MPGSRAPMYEEKGVGPTIEHGNENADINSYITHLPDADEAMKAFSDCPGQIVIDEATNKRLLRRIDLHLMPV
jgi:hypothetical protein